MSYSLRLLFRFNAAQSASEVFSSVFSEMRFEGARARHRFCATRLFSRLLVYKLLDAGDALKCKHSCSFEQSKAAHFSYLRLVHKNRRREHLVDALEHRLLVALVVGGAIFELRAARVGLSWAGLLIIIDESKQFALCEEQLLVVRGRVDRPVERAARFGSARAHNYRLDALLVLVRLRFASIVLSQRLVAQSFDTLARPVRLAALHDGAEWQKSIENAAILFSRIAYRRRAATICSAGCEFAASSTCRSTTT